MDSSEQSQICAQSLFVRSKPSPSAIWLRKWKRDSWTRHLSGRILRPSLGERFVTAWTSSLGDIPASPSAQPVSAKENKTRGTYGRGLQMAFDFSDHGSASLRTSKDISRWGCPTSSKTWQEWVTERRGAYSARLKLAHRTSESGCSSWPTPAARDYKGSYSPTALIRKDGKSRMDALPQVVEYDQTSWPTPTVAEGSKIGNQPNYGQKGLSNHPQIVGLPDRKKLNKSGKSPESVETITPRQTGKLNPAWVEQLMGIPVGWTDLGSWATE